MGHRSVIAAVVVGAVLLPAGLAACGSTSASRPSDVRSSLTSLLKPGENPAEEKLTGRRRGGTLTVYSANDFDSLDPGESYYVLDYAVDYATQRPLFSYMPNNASTVVPDMAAFMPTIANGGITDGGRTVTVHIRTSVRFSPPVNRAVTSADIAYAIERGANPNVANPYFAPYFGSDATAPLEGAQDQEYKGGPIPGIQTPNGSTIVFHMTKPGATLLIQALSLPLSAPVPESFARPLDRHKPTTYGSTYLVATGPYMLKSDPSGRFVGIGHQLGKSATLVRNPELGPIDRLPAGVSEPDQHRDRRIDDGNRRAGAEGLGRRRAGRAGAVDRQARVCVVSLADHLHPWPGRLLHGAGQRRGTDEERERAPGGVGGTRPRGDRRGAGRSAASGADDPLHLPRCDRLRTGGRGSRS